MLDSELVSELLRGIEDDIQSRTDWIEDRAQGLKLLGLKVEIPGVQGTSDGAPVEGMSRVRHPLLLEAVLRFQANARSELLPTDGPVKIRNDDNNATAAEDRMADALEREAGYRFRDRGLLEQALTHTSWAHESGAGAVADNETLEFLGDAVLQRERTQGSRREDLRTRLVGAQPRDVDRHRHAPALGAMRAQSGADVPDTQYITVTMDSGVSFVVCAGWSLPPAYPNFSMTWIEFVGTEGALVIDDTHRDTMLTTMKTGIVHPMSSMPGEFVNHTYAGPMSAETVHFLEAVACDRPVLVTAEQARQVMEVYIAADLSAERNEPVNLPLPESRPLAAAGGTR